MDRGAEAASRAMTSDRTLGLPFRIEARLKNGRLMRAREQSGFPTIAALARATGIPQSTISALETLRESPINATTKEWRAVAINIAELFGYSCDELWPEEIFEVRERALMLEIASVQSNNTECMEETVARLELSEHMSAVLKRLTPRERTVIEQRFFQDKTLDAISCPAATTGKMRIMAKENARQVEAKALRKLRHPRLSKLLAGHADGCAFAPRDEIP